MSKTNKNFFSKHFFLKIKIIYKFFFFISIKRKFFQNLKSKILTKKIFIFFLKKNKNFKFLKIKVYQNKNLYRKISNNIENLYFEIFFLLKKIENFIKTWA